jgi:hypothetical protein
MGRRTFLDAVAVQFPLNGKAATVPFMGDATRRCGRSVSAWTKAGRS